MSTARTHLEIIAPTVQEAIERGASELGLPEEALDVEILDEGTSGFLGLGSRQARVRLRARSPEKTKAEPEGDVAPPLERPVTEKLQDGDPIIAQTARETVEELLHHMHIEAEVTAHWGEKPGKGHIWPLFVDVHGKDLSILIGRRAETLSSLQYITRLILGKELRRPVSVIIDVEGYRERREQQLRRLARRIAKQAVERGRTIALEPMPANERRIVHIELRDHEEVYTESVGEGKRRKVTIRLRP